MQYIRHIILWCNIAISCITFAQPPRLTLIIILDQLSYDIFEKQQPYYQYALKTLTEKGISFSHFYHPHGKPKTATGHATFSTGTHARYHGIIDNSWPDTSGNFIKCDASSSQHAVFNPYGTTYDFGKGPEHLWLDTIFDQMALHTNKIVNMCISGKSRAAIMFSGRHGHTFWLDYATGGFTSSQFYYDQLPNWVTTFNNNHKKRPGDTISWEPVYSADHAAYQSNIPAYPGTKGKPQFNTSSQIPQNDSNAFKDYVGTPAGQKHLIDFAQAGLEHLFTTYPESHIVTCLSLSSSDYVGHYYGPESKAYRDMLYHADRDLQTLLNSISQYIAKEDMLIIFTSDHGGMPIPEQMATSGMPFAQRIPAQQLIKEINTDIAQTFGIDNIITSHTQPWLYIDMNRYNQLSSTTQQAITARIKQKLQEQPYIIDAMSLDELTATPTFTEREPNRLLQNQATPGRCGQFIYIIRPYCNVTEYSSGTTHATPYNFDTHVPCIMYQPGKYENATISDCVYATQLAPTLADIYHVPRPSGTYVSSLPLP